MSDVGRYRKVYPRLWFHDGFVALSEGERLVTLYVLCGPQQNRIGLCKFSISTAAEDLGTTPETFTKRLVKVCTTFNWLYDRKARVLFVPSWFKFNRPENENVLKGILKDLPELPSSNLLDGFARNVLTLPETLRQTFTECCQQHLAKRSPIQEQEHSHEPEQFQEHEQAQTAGAGTSTANLVAEHVALAREALALTDADLPLEKLIDALQYHARNKAVTILKRQATTALNTVLSERRTRGRA